MPRIILNSQQRYESTDTHPGVLRLILCLVLACLRMLPHRYMVLLLRCALRQSCPSFTQQCCLVPYARRLSYHRCGLRSYAWYGWKTPACVTRFCLQELDCRYRIFVQWLRFPPGHAQWSLRNRDTGLRHPSGGRNTDARDQHSQSYGCSNDNRLRHCLVLCDRYFVCNT